MGQFDTLNLAAQGFAETTAGEAFTYTDTKGVVTSGFTGVFNQVAIDYQFSDFSTKKITTYTLISSKAQWTISPTDDGLIADSSGIKYSINQISGANSAGEPAYEFSLKKLT